LQLASLLYKKHRCVETSRFFKHRYNYEVALASRLPSGTLAHQVSVLQTPSQPAHFSSPKFFCKNISSLLLAQRAALSHHSLLSKQCTATSRPSLTYFHNANNLQTKHMSAHRQQARSLTV
jgi:hypothetical protein